jgi:UPF0755 protein
MAIRSVVLKVLIVVLVITVLGGSVWYFSLSNKKSSFTISSGESAYKVADMLIEKNIIGSKRMFLGLVKITNSGKKIQTGYYEFSQRDNIFTVLAQLRSGSKNFIKITIPEGSNIKQIAAIVKSKIPTFDEDKFIKIASERKLEGYLMPETYFVSQNFTEENMIKIMRDEFDKKVTAAMYDRAKELGIPMKNIIIMASIVEKEAVKPEERAIIAGVFYSRLKKGIRLESCATVLYAMGIYKAALSIADTKYPSPYNTYLHYGLPPAPITNPGIEAIKAALYPVETENLYFVASGGGKHLFSPNLEQHVKNKNEVKAIQREKKAAAVRTSQGSQGSKKSSVDRVAAQEATMMLDAQQIARPKKTASNAAANRGGNR